MADGTVVIKKYSDRRLYDTSARKYVNLDDIARMIRDGVDIEVRDARTGKDLTRVVLTQIIVEDTREGQTGVPVKLLRQIVAASDHATHDFLSWYFETASELYRKAGSALLSRVAGARTAVSNPVDFMRHLLGGEEPGNQASEIDALRARVLELEARLEKGRRRPRTRKPRP